MFSIINSKLTSLYFPLSSSLCIRNSDKMYDSTWSCIRSIYASEGVKGFYKGLGPNILRSVGGAVLLISYDEFKSAFNLADTQISV